MNRRPSASPMSRIVAPRGATTTVDGAAEPVVRPCFVHGLISASPTPGRFYQVTADDKPSSVTRRALDAYQRGLGDKGAARVRLLLCMTADVRWNAKNYGSPRTASWYPEAHGLEGVTLAAAFDPVHAPAIPSLECGMWPGREIDAEGNGPETGEYGLLWIPWIDRFEPMSAARASVYLPVCLDYEPPAELLDVLRAPPRSE